LTKNSAKRKNKGLDKDYSLWGLGENLQVIQRIKKWGINTLHYINYLYSDICFCCLFNGNFCYGKSSV